MKVTLKADRWKESGKSFTKNDLLLYIFQLQKMFFIHCLQSIFYLIWTHAISSLRSQICGAQERHWKHLPQDPFEVSIIVKTQKIIND